MREYPFRGTTGNAIALRAFVLRLASDGAYVHTCQRREAILTSDPERASVERGSEAQESSYDDLPPKEAATLWVSPQHATFVLGSRE